MSEGGPSRAPALHLVMNAIDQLARTASNEAFLVDDMLCDLCLVTARALGLTGAEVRLGVGDEGWWIDGSRGRTVGVTRGIRTLPEMLGADGAAASGCRAAADAVVIIPVVAAGNVWGRLVLSTGDSDPWSQAQLDAAQLFVRVATSYIALAALRDRAVVVHHQLEHLATHDILTGLPNRGLLLDRLEHAVLSAARHRVRAAVLFVDIDGFKDINDSLGHNLGDLVLVQVARRIGMALRANDTLGRLSGDEFVVICEDLGGSMAETHRWLHALGRRIQAQLRRRPTASDLEIVVSVSIGVAVTSELCDPQDLINDADRAMYRAKQAGGGRLVISRPEVVALRDRHSLQEPMRAR
jgi:diguanylate cyclase (GGDEF)-like protein